MDLDGYRLTAASHVTADFTVGGGVVWLGRGLGLLGLLGLVFSVDLDGLADFFGKMKLICKVRTHFELKRDACKLELGNGYMYYHVL